MLASRDEARFQGLLQWKLISEAEGASSIPRFVLGKAPLANFSGTTQRKFRSCSSAMIMCGSQGETPPNGHCYRVWGLRVENLAIGRLLEWENLIKRYTLPTSFTISPLLCRAWLLGGLTEYIDPIFLEGDHVQRDEFAVRELRPLKGEPGIWNSMSLS
ncbi:hypothetical protein VNO77_04146 [Canavalia gladiata]|uniref:Uncharacterized protein n=1 Tax=Canavalia gladiata TaxID=3824 RepID=A0AAN9N163_CANGL